MEVSVCLFVYLSFVSLVVTLYGLKIILVFYLFFYVLTGPSGCSSASNDSN